MDLDRDIPCMTSIAPRQLTEVKVVDNLRDNDDNEGITVRPGWGIPTLEGELEYWLVPKVWIPRRLFRKAKGA